MAVQKVKVFKYKCDNPDCSTVVYTENETEFPTGISGNFIWHHTGGGARGAFWACDEPCLQPAISEVFVQNQQ